MVKKRALVISIIILCLSACNKKEYTPKYDIKNEEIDSFIYHEINNNVEFEPLFIDIRNERVVVLDYENNHFDGEKIKAPFMLYHKVIIENDSGNIKYYLIRICIYNDYPNDKYLESYELLKSDVLNNDINYIDFGDKKLLILSNNYPTITVSYGNDKIKYNFEEKYFALWLYKGYEINFE